MPLLVRLVGGGLPPAKKLSIPNVTEKMGNCIADIFGKFVLLSF